MAWPRRRPALAGKSPRRSASADQANFTTLSEKGLSFCTDLAHYCPIKKCWRPVARAAHVTAGRLGGESASRREGARAVRMKSVRDARAGRPCVPRRVRCLEPWWRENALSEAGTVVGTKGRRGHAQSVRGPGRVVCCFPRFIFPLLDRQPLRPVRLVVP